MRWLPNLLTCVRIALTPLIVYFVVRGPCRYALPVTLLAGFSDAADGYLARRLRAETRLGAWLDPLADKFLLVSLYVAFGAAGLLPKWVVWLVIGRDVLILTLAAAGLILTPIRDFPPTVWGKASTVIQIAASLIVLSSCSSVHPRTWWVLVAIWSVAAGTVWSGVHYFWRAATLFRATQEKV